MAADEVSDVFDSLFASKIQAVKATRDVSDDIALAGDMITTASSLENNALAALIYEKIHTLTSTSPQGFETAIDANTRLAALMPDKKLACAQRVSDLRRLAYLRASRTDKATVGAAYAEALASLGDAQAASGQWTAAVASYRRAAAPALKLGINARVTVKKKLDFAMARVRIEKKIASLKSTLDAKPNDRATAKELTLLYLSELNDPAAASTAALQAGDPQLLARVKLMAKPATSLTEQEAFSLGDWARSLASTASPVGKPRLLSRAHQCYQVYLREHEAKDLSRTKAEVALRDVEKALLGLGLDAPSIDAVATNNPNQPGIPDLGSPFDNPRHGKPADEWIDIAKLIDVEKDSIQGTWMRNGSSLGTWAATGTDWSHYKLSMPVEIKGDYDLTYEFRQAEGGLVIVSFPVGDRFCSIVHDIKTIGFDHIDGKSVWDANNPARATSAPIRSHQRHKMELQVRLKGSASTITLNLDGQKVLTWTGAESRLTASKSWCDHRPNRLQFNYTTQKTVSAHFDSIRIKSLDGSIKKLRDAESPKIVDVASLIDVSKDVVEGVWRKVGTQFTVTNNNDFGVFSKLKIPLVVTGDYCIRFDVLSGGRATVMLPIGDRHANVRFNFGGRSGLEMVDGKGWLDSTNPASVEKSNLAPGRSHSFAISVRTDKSTAGIRVEVDQKPFLAWRGDISRLSQSPSWRMTERGTLGIGAGLPNKFKSVVFDSVRVESISGTIKSTRGESFGESSSNSKTIKPTDGWQELLPKVTEASIRTGTWTKSQTGWQAGSGRVALELPVHCRGDYALRVAFRRPQGKMAFQVTLPVSDHVTEFIIDGFHNRGGGTNLWRVVSSRPTMVPGFQITNGKEHQLEINVKQTGPTASISTSLDGKALFSWRGDPSLLSLDSELAKSGFFRGKPCLVTWAKGLEVRAAAVRVLSGEATLAASGAASDSSSQATGGLNKGLVAHWTFDGVGSGMAKDASGKGNDLKIVGAVTTAGVRGKAILFDGKGDAARYPALGSHKNFSIAAWLRRDRAPGNQQAIIQSDGWREQDVHFSIRPSGDFALGVYVPDRGRKWFDGYSNFQFDRSDIGQWRHVAVCFSSTDKQVRYYINGELDKQIGLADVKAVPTFRTGQLGVWKNQPLIETSAARHFYGALDDVRIYDRAIPQSDIKAIITKAVNEAKKNPNAPDSLRGKLFEFGKD